MKAPKSIKKWLGSELEWDFFGEPDGYPGKIGSGKICSIEFLSCFDPNEVTVIFDVISKETGNFVKVPNSCVTKIHKKAANG